MAYFGADIKNIIAEILEAKKSKGGVKNLYFVGCGGSLGALYPAKTFMEKECASIKSAWINSNEFVHSTPRDFGENSIICLACHKGNTPPWPATSPSSTVLQEGPEPLPSMPPSFQRC